VWFLFICFETCRHPLNPIAPGAVISETEKP
jgi:hypothetical protein